MKARFGPRTRTCVSAGPRWLQEEAAEIAWAPRRRGERHAPTTRDSMTLVHADRGGASVRTLRFPPRIRGSRAPDEALVGYASADSRRCNGSVSGVEQSLFQEGPQRISRVQLAIWP